ncbi:hypothetical protein CDD83_10859 [Cordyceps sp. RAO-2017]|nr:hypothetical protein CDD83_10859 [Cordyceps sp. RAO-2017]
MRLHSLVVTLGLAGPLFAHPLDQPQGPEHEATTKSRILQLPIVVSDPREEDVGNRNEGSVDRRGVIDRPLIEENSMSGVFVELTVGNPGQKVKVHLGTGSSKLFVISAPDDPDQSLSQPELFFNASKSQTIKGTGKSDSVSYADGSAADWEVYEDDISLGSTSVGRVPFGVTPRNLTTGSKYGIWGMNMAKDNKLFRLMAEKGLISSRAFSLDVGNASTHAGFVTFGGLDTKKFSGPLVKLPLVTNLNPIVEGQNKPESSPTTRYAVILDKISMSENGQKKGIFDRKDRAEDVQVILDSGSQYNVLPTFLFDEFVRQFPDARKSTYGRFSVFPQHHGSPSFLVVDCALKNSTATIDFTFGEATIRVPFSEFIVQRQFYACELGVMELPKFSTSHQTLLKPRAQRLAVGENS